MKTRNRKMKEKPDTVTQKGKAPLPDPEMELIIADMEEFIQKEVKAGFDAPSSISRAAIEIFSDEEDEKPILRPIALRLTQEAVDAQVKEQSHWPEITDCDRLDAAFEELQTAGILCRQNFSDCGTCGLYEMDNEIEAAIDRGWDPRGFTFYHMQDTENAMEGRGLYLNFGSVEEEATATRRIGRQIVKALNRQGLKTQWNGRLDTRIFLQLDWKRRMPVEGDF